jgi:hypothetical protein
LALRDLSLFPQLEIKLKDHHFDTTWVIKAELQAVLNTLANTTSRMHLKKGRRAGNGEYAVDTLRVMAASRHKVSF